MAAVICCVEPPRLMTLPVHSLEARDGEPPARDRRRRKPRQRRCMQIAAELIEVIGDKEHLGCDELVSDLLRFRDDEMRTLLLPVPSGLT